MPIYHAMSVVQSVFGLTVDGWTVKTMRTWLAKEGYKPIKPVHKLGTELRFRLHEPSKFKRFRIKKLPNKIYLVLGFKS